MAMGKSKRLDNSISALADLFEYGHLMASSDPSGFIDAAATEIRESRTRFAELERALRRPPQPMIPTSDHLRRLAMVLAFHHDWEGVRPGNADVVLDYWGGLQPPLQRQWLKQAEWLIDGMAMLEVSDA
jgi:hypothetical protein